MAFISFLAFSSIGNPVQQYRLIGSLINTSIFPFRRIDVQCAQRSGDRKKPI